MEWLVIGSGVGHSEPKPLRHHPHCHQDGRGVHLHRAHTRGDRVRMPYPSEEMICWPVSARVGNVKNNDPSLIEPIAGAG